MLCQICKKAEATVHLTQVVGGKIRKLDLCAACAEKCGVDDPAGFSMLEILKKFSHAISSDKEEPQPKKKQTEELVCPECGYTSQDLSKTGKLGCPFCYKTFVENLENALKHMHRGTQHIGKTPKYHPLPESGVKPAAAEPPVKKTRKRAAAKTASSKKKAGAPDVYENPELLEELYESKKALLKQTIEEENYEYAAKIRDEIKELEKKIKAKKVKKDENQDLLDALKTLFDSVEGADK